MHIISKLKNTSANIDEMPVRILKEIGALVAETLAGRVNRSFRRGVFPDNLKIAKVAPIYKSGNAQEVSNYRPISVLPVFSKIIERCMSHTLMNFLLKFKTYFS